MSFELEGRLIHVFEEQQITDSFKKREFVIETENIVGDTVYNERVKFQLVQAKCDKINSFSLGNQLKVSFNVKGRRYEKDGKLNFFNSLDAWKIEKVNDSSYFSPTASSTAPKKDEDSNDYPPF